MNGQSPLKNQYNERRTIDMLLNERKIWALAFVGENKYKKCGVSPEFIKQRLAIPITEEAINYIIDNVNQVLIELITKARDNGIHRRALQIDVKDVVLAMNYKSIGTKNEILPFNDPIQPANNPIAHPNDLVYSSAIASYEQELTIMNEILSYKP